MVVQHASNRYGPRTKYNVDYTDATFAMAFNSQTAGELMTHRFAGNKLINVCIVADMDSCIAPSALTLLRGLKERKAKRLNIAGNGIYTCALYGKNQQDINAFVYAVLKAVHILYPIEKILTGGQTGFDIAGAVAAHRLGIPYLVTLPKGFVQRHEDGIDREYSQAVIQSQIVMGAALLPA